MRLVAIPSPGLEDFGSPIKSEIRPSLVELRISKDDGILPSLNLIRQF